jgi:hypothetical protein
MKDKQNCKDIIKCKSVPVHICEKIIKCSRYGFTARVLFIACCLVLFALPLPAQEIPEQEELDEIADTEIEPDAEQEEEGLTSEQRRLEMEIKTSTIPELAVWCRSLGLSESGTREELSRRIRQYYELPEPREPNINQRIITIESAQISEYFKIDVVDEEYARLSGDVRLTLKDNDASHRISADEILFNRTRNLLTARGNVEYIKETGDSLEIFRGQSITANIDDWSSIFLDGNTEHAVEGDATSYLFSGTVISRSSDEVTVLNNAFITNAKNQDALWSINASKLWLLVFSVFLLPCRRNYFSSRYWIPQQRRRICTDYHIHSWTPKCKSK